MKTKTPMPKYSPAADAAAAGTPVRPMTLRGDAVHQTIAGYGASACWWAQDVGGWEADKVDTVVSLLFDRERGIGLNIYRYEIGAGPVNEAPDPWRRAETLETAPGQYDWTRNTNAIAVMQAAVAAGVDNVMVFANSPAARMTYSGKTTGEDEGNPNLRPQMEADFARYLVDIAQHFQAQGIPVRYISPINEPQWNWKLSNGQEGCHYKPDQCVSMARALVRELRARGSDIRPSLIDSGKWLDENYTIALCRMLVADPEIAAAMDHYAIHSYWSADDDKRATVERLRAAGVKLPLWQSEWCQMEGGRDEGMGAALVLAKVVHEDMTIPDCPAWIGWIAVSCYDFKDGLLYVDLNTHEVAQTKKLWALGNYSRFVRPGYRRVELEGVPYVLPTSAYVSPDGYTAVLVTINDDEARAVTAHFTAEGYTHCEAYETSDAHSLDCVFQGSVGDYVFPPRSVTTLVLTR